jgi:phosphoribosylformylglycinamidine (FGAM) synthase-like amidotransferase family enzyme
MPHPERVSDPVLGSEEGMRILRSVLAGARV